MYQNAYCDREMSSHFMQPLISLTQFPQPVILHASFVNFQRSDTPQVTYEIRY